MLTINMDYLSNSSALPFIAQGNDFLVNASQPNEAFNEISSLTLNVVPEFFGNM